MHWPQNIPDTRNIVTLWEEYPGPQSIIIPADGTAHEWITSLEEATIWSLISMGIATAPVAWRRIMFATPLLTGLNWFLNKELLLPNVFELFSPPKR